MAPCITFRYQQLLIECHQYYFTQRELLLSSSVAGSITELSVTHKGDHCSLVRSSCAFLVHVCQDEHQLFYQFFSQPTPLLTWVHFLEIFQPTVNVLLFLQFYLSVTFLQQTGQVMKTDKWPENLWQIESKLKLHILDFRISIFLPLKQAPDAFFHLYWETS